MPPALKSTRPFSSCPLDKVLSRGPNRLRTLRPDAIFPGRAAMRRPFRTDLSSLIDSKSDVTALLRHPMASCSLSAIEIALTLALAMTPPRSGDSVASSSMISTKPGGFDAGLPLIVTRAPHCALSAAFDASADSTGANAAATPAMRFLVLSILAPALPSGHGSEGVHMYDICDS